MVGARRFLAVLAVGAAALAAASSAAAYPAHPHRAKIKQWPISIDAERKAATREWARFHYGVDSWTMPGRPRVIVEHMTESPDALSAWEWFDEQMSITRMGSGAPGTCTQFLVDMDGTIYQLAPIRFICRHATGLAYTAIGIEHAGVDDSGVIYNRRQLVASLRLTRWLQCRYGILRRNVVGHNESRESPYMREHDVATLAKPNHLDMPKSAMKVYRSHLGPKPCSRTGRR